MRHIFQRLLPRRLWLAGLPCLALLGCVQSHNKPAIDTPAEEKIPVYQLADYLSTECSDIWALQGKSTETNPLYWLRAMDCADRLMPAQSRQQARQYDDGSWQNTFKQGILLADAKITPYERRQLVARIDALSTKIPAQVRPLYQLWRDGQALQLQLAEERQRYSKLQQSSDSELDTLRQQHHVLQQQLELTTRKLENLTDIERQLSTANRLEISRRIRHTRVKSPRHPPMRSLLMSHKPAHLLLVDDDPGLLKLLGLRLTSEGYSVVTAESGAEGLRVLNREKVDLVISDLRMDEMDGMQLFAEIQKVQPGMPVIILTAHGSIPDAVAATQQGVFSFLTKPVDKDALYQAIDDALEQSAPATDERWREAIVTRSPLMLRLLEQARLVAQSDVSVLINGQSGTGKEIFAQAIHNASPRNSKPFIAINCGALPEQLLESELFGHARGAFTGAVSNREGLFQAAEGGTLFLDEIGDMPAPLQVKLLRVLQERKVRPLGSNRDIDIDVRIISATHRDLPKAMARGEFREDLYYRLNVVSLKIPALAERTEDIPLLANHLLRQAAERHKPFVRAFSTDAMKRLMTASWPGNVRQLVNVIEQCVALTSSPVISDALVEQALEGENTALPTFVEARNQFELNYLRKLLQITKGNVTHAARMAGRNRTEFYKLLSRHELDANDFKE